MEEKKFTELIKDTIRRNDSKISNISLTTGRNNGLKIVDNQLMITISEDLETEDKREIYLISEEYNSKSQIEKSAAKLESSKKADDPYTPAIESMNISKMIANFNEMYNEERTSEGIKLVKEKAANKKNKVKKCTNKNRNNKRLKLAGKTKNKNKKMAERLGIGIVGFGIATTALVMGGGCAAKDQPREKQGKTVNPTGITSENIEQEKTIKDVKEDFLKRYIKAYNEKYGTDYDYKNAQFRLPSNGKNLYVDDDGEIVTQGAHPYETREWMDGWDYLYRENVSSDERLIQITNGDPSMMQVLGTYFYGDSEQFVFSGNANKEEYKKYKKGTWEKPTLENLEINHELIDAAAWAEYCNIIKDSEKSSVKQYFELVEKLDKKATMVHEEDKNGNTQWTVNLNRTDDGNER